MTIAIDLGGGAVAAPLDLEELLATRLLVQGNSGSGKSHLLRRLLEQSAPHVQQVIIDPEGDFVGLAERYGHVVVDGDRSVADLDCIAARIRKHRVSAVLSLEDLEAEAQMRAAAVFLNALFEAPRDMWFPMLVVVDEAQLFAPAIGGDVSEEARKASLGAMTNLMCRGRKRGLAGVIATQRLAKLAKNVAAEATNFLMGRTFLDIDMARAGDLLGLERRQAEMFRELQRGEFVALGPALSRRPVTIRVGPVETRARAGTPALTPLPDQPTPEARDRLLASVPAGPGRLPPERPKLAPPITAILAEIERDAPGEAESGAPALPPGDVDWACRTIAHAVLAEPEAAFRPDAVLVQDFILRCRLARLPGGSLPLAEVKLCLNAARADIDPTGLDQREPWARAIGTARRIPEDLQAVYLILAAAALQGAPCPSDRAIAQRCGHHAEGRARSRVGHLEKCGLLIVRRDFSGRRAIVLPDLGWETALAPAQSPVFQPGPDRPIGRAARIAAE